MISSIRMLGNVEFPPYSDIRVMMMPIDLAWHAILPRELRAYEDFVRKLVRVGPRQDGIGYLTIDEAVVRRGEHHRRPGLHVDGAGGWGGPSPWASAGMIVAASTTGCVAWDQEFDGEPGEDGNCEHLRNQCRRDRCYALCGGEAWFCGPTAVHESVPLPFTMRRQFVRVSMPSDAPWFESYTPNPDGVKPTGPILPGRAAQMAWRL